MRLSSAEFQDLHNALLQSFDRSALIRALRFGLDKDLEQITLASNQIEVVFDVINTAEKEGWISGLVRAARSANPGGPALVAFQEKYPYLLEAPEPARQIDLFNACFLRGRQLAFVDRDPLRRALKSLADREGSRVLVVDGPEASGKSYSLEFITYLKERLGTFKVAWIDLTEADFGPLGPDELVRRIAIQMERDIQLIPTRRSLDPGWAGELCDWLVAQVNESRASWWVVLDGIQQVSLPPVTHQVINGLALRAELLVPSLRLILLSCKSETLPARIANRILKEQIERIGEAHIQRFFETLFEERAEAIDPRALKEITGWMSDQAPPDHPRQLYLLAEAVQRTASSLFDIDPAPGFTWTRALVLQKLLLQPAEVIPPIEGIGGLVKQQHAIDLAYRQAAAVLASFSAETLRPAVNAYLGDTEAINRLLYECVKVNEDEIPPRWTMRSQPRREALESLGSRAALQAALAANWPRPDDPVQQMLEAYITNTAPPVEAQDLDQLASTAQVLEWLAGILAGLPDLELVRRWLERETLLRPMRQLAGDHFQNRQKELQALRDYIEIPISGPLAGPRPISMETGLSKSRPLFIYGPGGIGKSSLIARVILEHAVAENGFRFPFASLDFSRLQVLVANEPASLLVEAARQLGIQHPELRARIEQARSRWSSWLSEIIFSKEEIQPSARLLDNSQSLGHERTRITREFAELLHLASPPEQPFLFVLDTFEELQFQGRNLVMELGGFLDQLQSLVPRLRTVIVGRALSDAFSTLSLELGVLDPEAAAGFLGAQGITEPWIIEQILQTVGRSPLSLKLAAEMVEKAGAGQAGIEYLDHQSLFFSLTDQAAIQRKLFIRSVNHIHNPKVRKLVDLGMVLRRITPEIILQVLVEPAGLAVSDMQEAQDLFAELQHEVIFVAREADGALHFRPDFRRLALELINADEPVRAAEIHRLAAAYYRSQAGIPARAEEIYHLLFVQADFGLIEERWQIGVEPYLLSAIEEVPGHSRPFLVSQLGIVMED